VLLLASACGGHYVARGSDLYRDGHYVEAAEVFEQTEERLASSSNSERARFGLYRGATFLELGDAPHAARWLGYAREIVKADPGALGHKDLSLLDASLKAVASAKPAERASHSNAELATAPSEPGAAPAQ
jgi:hypothetical protein